MFTGIIEETGYIEMLRKGGHTSQLTIHAQKILGGMAVGDSIAVNGCCLTVASFNQNYFTADVMNETWRRTALAQLKRGDFVNLERALPVNGRFGGHIVTGHVDGTGTIRAITRDSNSIWYRIEFSKDLRPYIVEKGSIAIDGISLTVARVSRTDFSVSIIPHTFEETILKNKRTGQMVNLENDLIGKYVLNFLQPR